MAAAADSPIVKAYEQQWLDGATPDLVAYVSATPGLEARVLAALIHVDQRFRALRGGAQPPEAYFANFPILRNDAELATDVIYLDYTLRREARERVSPEQYLERFPDLAEQLQMQFVLDRALAGEASSLDSLPDGPTVDLAPLYKRSMVIAGRYKLLEEVGEGGMGSVWVAQQVEPVRRLVAIKLIKPGMDSRTVLSRFDAERQALAMMDHPNIAKVLDGGVTEQGRPFFVMEYVKGAPITEFCDSSRMTLKERLALFVQVCQAVQHAHQKGIIHRDLKPSNILICLYDGQPIPKVIDFGLAKAMHQPLTELTLHTAHGVMVGTPLYMSPEQAEFNNLDIDTRTDVYSLGVILYELLTGTTPLDRQQFRKAAWQEIVRLIKEEDPSKPSTKISGDDSLPSVAAHRRLEPAQLSRAMRGDLDCIVMKSLEKDRSRRYETANGLARDIERYLHDEPVEASPPSAVYKLRKFAHRHRVAFGTVGLVSLALVCGTTFALWQAVRATQAERVAQAAREEEALQRAQAEENLQTARKAVDEYFTLISENTLLDVPGLEPLRRELLEGAIRFYDEFSRTGGDDPAALTDVAAANLRLGVIYLALNRADESLAANDRALEAIDLLRRKYPRAIQHTRKLGGFWKGLRWTQLSIEQPRDPIAAQHTMQRLASTWRGLVAAHPEEVAFQVDYGYIQSLLGSTLTAAGQRAAGIGHFRQACEIAEQIVEHHPQVPQYRADLAMASHLLAEALRSGHRIEPLWSETRPGAARQTAPELDEAIQLWRRAVELGEQLVSETPQAPAYRAALVQSLTAMATQIGQQHPSIWQGRAGDVGELQLLGGEYGIAQRALAEEHFRRANELADQLVREFPNQRLYWELRWLAGSRWGEFESNRGKLVAADRVLREVIETLQAHVRIRPTDRMFREQLARLCDEVAGRSSRRSFIEQLRRRALELYRDLATEYPDNPDYLDKLALAHGRLGELLSRHELPQFEQARSHLEDCIAIFGQMADSPAPQRDGYYRAQQAGWLGRLAVVLQRAGNPREAQAAHQRRIGLYDALASEFPGNAEYRRATALATAALAQCYMDNRQPESAVKQWQHAIELSNALEAPTGDVIAQRIVSLRDWYAHLAQAVIECGAADEVLQALDQAVKSGASPETCHKLAWRLVKSPPADERLARRAMELAQHAVAKGPSQLAFQPKFAESGPFYRVLGIAQLRVGDWAAAVESLRAARRIDKANELDVDGYLLALAYRRLRQAETARQWFAIADGWRRLNRDASLPTSSLVAIEFFDTEKDVVGVYELDEPLQWAVADRWRRLDRADARPVDGFRREAAEALEIDIDQPSPAADSGVGVEELDELVRQLIELDPEANWVNLWQAERCAEMGAWDTAAELFAQAKAADPNNVTIHYMEALTCLELGDTARYVEVCSTMLDRFGQLPAWSDPCYWTVLACTVGPGALDNFARLTDWARDAAEGPANVFSPRDRVFGMALYRAGKWHEAVATLEAAVYRIELKVSQQGALTWPTIMLAMAQYRAGRHEDAVRLLNEARALSELSDPINTWRHRTIARMLFAEAETLIGPAQR